MEDVSYENVCMRQVTNPIVITTMYTTFAGEKLPVYRNIRLRDVNSVTSGSLVFLGLDAAHKIGVSLDHVSVGGRPLTGVRGKDAEIEIAPSDSRPAMACSFPAFPMIPTAPEAAQTVPPEDPTLYVAASGTGDYWSIQRAIDSAPASGATISIAPGVYREVLKIEKPNIRLVSPYDDAAKTVIVFDRSAGSSVNLRSATVEVRANGFRARNLTIANDYNRTHPQLAEGSQAIALLVTGDQAVLRNVRLLGNQDTLYVSSGRQYFADCFIEGNMDFIFGDGKAVFENCEIHSTNHAVGYLTAQGKVGEWQDSGFVFNHCRLTAEPGVSNVYLGRPWHPYATVVFLNTWMNDHILPAGWSEWHRGETHSLETAYYAEYNSTGPGGELTGRDPHAKKLTAAKAARYETRAYLAGSDHWDPTRQ